MTSRGYQYDYSDVSAEMHSIEGRKRKAMTMVAVLGDALGERLAQVRMLNVGCSTGIIDESLAPHVGRVMGIDIDAPAVEAANRRCALSNVEFRVGDAMNLDFPDASFDVVICSQVYEHVPDSGRMMNEIHRVLMPGGVCYLAATNRFCLIEKHYHLPFLSIIPVRLAHLYLRVLGRGKYYYERHLGLNGLRHLVRRFEVRDYTHRILDEPKAFAAEYMIDGRLKRKLVRAFARYAYAFFPGYIWLLEKK